MSALDASVDDHDCRSKAGLQLSLCVFLVRLRGKNDFITVSRHFLFEKSHLPRPVNHVKHAGFWWLGISVKPDLDRDCNCLFIMLHRPSGGGEVEPRGRHQIRILQQRVDVSRHCVRERSVVEVVRKLFCPAAVVLLASATRPRTTLERR